jgi:hypothetical protein
VSDEDYREYHGEHDVMSDKWCFYCSEFFEVRENNNHCPGCGKKFITGKTSGLDGSNFRWSFRRKGRKRI